MQKKLLYKILAIAALMLLIGIPLMMIQSTIAERMRFRDEAVHSIATDSVREQTLVGPILVLPYTEEIDTVSAADKDDKDAKPKRGTRVVQHHQLFYPSQLDIAGNIGTERRYRGIHQVLVYTGQYTVSGDFVLPREAELVRDSAASRLSVGRPYVSLPVADVRGIHDIPKLSWGGRQVEFEQGAWLLASPSGIHASLAVADLKLGEAKPGERVAFRFALGLAGIERQHFVPVGKNNLVTIASNWAHPQFGGNFLPERREVGEAGFSAMWRISALASGAQQQFDALERAGAPSKGAQGPQVDSFHVGFIEPVNTYSQAERATKYGLLFVALTFAAFFVFEIMRGLAIHPMQYLLVGLALAMFFLLLVGLSEHLPFLVAYLIAAAACIALIAHYLSHVLGERRRGMGFGAALVVLYSALYGLLISENNALVLGSLLLFAVLAALMVATRKLDWYQINKENAATAP